MEFGKLDLDPNKAPIFDGFSTHFYHVCWNIIKHDSCRMLNWSRKKPNS